jgi:hypothetical protein
MLRTGRARCLTGPLLIEASEAVAADATKLPNFGLEETYDHGSSDGWRTERPGRIQKLLPCSSCTNGILGGGFLTRRARRADRTADRSRPCWTRHTTRLVHNIVSRIACELCGWKPSSPNGRILLLPHPRACSLHRRQTRVHRG